MCYTPFVGTYPITNCKTYLRGFLINVLGWNGCKKNINVIYILENIEFQKSNLNKIVVFSVTIVLLIGYC